MAGRVSNGSRVLDVVAIIDVIEHVTDPLALMKEIRRVTKPGGIVYLVTPNIDSLSAIEDKLLYLDTRDSVQVIARARGA